MNKTCPQCGEQFLGTRSDKKFCSDICRAKHHKGLPPVPNALPDADIIDGGPVVQATLTELSNAGQVASSAGAVALQLAHRIDNAAMETGSGLASLARQHGEVMTKALAAAKPAADPINELRARRDGKRAAS